MGRKKKDWKPDITPRKQWLADDFLKYIGTIYEEYFSNFVKILGWDEDLVQESILRTYQAILWNGCDKPIYITEDTPENIRHDAYRYKWFIACKSNNTVGKPKYDINNSDTFDDEVTKLSNSPSDTSQKKVMKDIYNDYRTMYLLDLVCSNYDIQTCYCFRLYYCVPGMTYKKLTALTKMKDAKTRVVAVNKYLRENLDKITDDIDTHFREEYPDFDF